VKSPPGAWLLGLGLGAAALFVVWSAPETPSPVGRGSEAPAFELPSLDGGSESLADAGGKVLLVNFWATWCKPCEDEMPAMEKLYQALADEGFLLVAISVDDDTEAVKAFRERLQLSFPILLDPGATVAKLYQTYRYPESFLIGPGGDVVERYVGPKPWDDAAYVQRIRRLLAGGRQARSGPLVGGVGAGRGLG